MAANPQSARRTIPLARPDIGERELELVTQVLRSDVLAMGGFTERFEAGIWQNVRSSNSSIRDHSTWASRTASNFNNPSRCGRESVTLAYTLMC